MLNMLKSLLCFIFIFTACVKQKTLITKKNDLADLKKRLLVAPPPVFKTKNTKRLKPIKIMPKPRNYGIFKGDKGIIIHKSGKITFMTGGSKIAEFFFYFNTPYFSWISTNSIGFKNIKISRKTQIGEYLFTADFPLEKKNTLNMHYGKYKQKIKLLNSGLIQIDINYSTPVGFKKNIIGKGFFCRIPNNLSMGKKYITDNIEYLFPKNSSLGIPYFFRKKISSFIFRPDSIKNKFSLSGIKSPYSRFDYESKGFTTLRFPPTNTGKLSLTLDLCDITSSSLKESSDFFAGIDFWNYDRLHIPKFSESRNLLPNPSFESGLRYYTNQDKGQYKPSIYPIYSIDKTQAKFGNSSLLILARGGFSEEPPLQTFTIPTLENKQYTFSFYAKSNVSHQIYLLLTSISGVWLEFPKLGRVELTKQWERYVFTFTAPNKAITMLIQSINYSTNNIAKVWVDGLQLEQNKQVSKFTDKVISIQLLTSNEDNFLNNNMDVNAKLKIVATPKTTGHIKCKITDFFYENIFEKKFDFSTNEKGVAIINLNINKLIEEGIYIIRTDIELNNGYKLTNFLRLTRMIFLNNTHKNKNIFATNMAERHTNLEKYLNRVQKIGFGFTNYIDTREKYTNYYKKYNIDIGVSIILRPKDNIKNKELIEKIKEINNKLKTTSVISPKLEIELENISYQMAKELPWIRSFSIDTETELGERYKVLTLNKLNEFAKLLIAVYKGVKRYDKNIKVYLDGGPGNMNPQLGTRWIDKYLTAVNGRVKFDAVAIHPYRTTPESPDLDDDARELFKVLKKHEYDDVPVYWNEGIYYRPFYIPEWGLSPYKGCSTDHWRCGTPTYDMGWAERIATAYYARSWLVALKYQDRVKEFNGWCSWMFMDTNLTPYAITKACNTLGNILGNASFKRDIRFAPQMRAYLFEDRLQRPIAVLWSYIPNVDRGKETPPIAEANFTNCTPEFINLMGNKRKAKINSKNNTIFPISSFPLFIRGRAGSLKELTVAISNIKIKGEYRSPLLFDLQPITSNKFKLKIKNVLTKTFKGKVNIDFLGKTRTFNIELQNREVQNIILYSKKNILKDNKITRVKIPLTIKIPGENNLNKKFSIDCFSVKKNKDHIFIDGDLDDWENISEIKFKNRRILKTKGGFITKFIGTQKVGYKGDHEATFKMCWDDNYLYIAVNVVDDKFIRLPNNHGKYNYYNDTLQIYIDVFCDARLKNTKGFDGNDYNFDFFPNPANKTAIPFRRFAPEQQITGGIYSLKIGVVEPNIKSAFKITKKGYIYEIAFPKKYILPLKLKVGTVFGFGMIINDRDGKYMKSGLTLTPPGTQPYMAPYLYPVVILDN